MLKTSTRLALSLLLLTLLLGILLLVGLVFRSYWAVTVGTSLLDYIPVIGPAISRLILGGPEVSGATRTDHS